MPRNVIENELEKNTGSYRLGEIKTIIDTDPSPENRRALAKILGRTEGAVDMVWSTAFNGKVIGQEKQGHTNKIERQIEAVRRVWGRRNFKSAPSAKKTTSAKKKAKRNGAA